MSFLAIAFGLLAAGHIPFLSLSLVHAVESRMNATDYALLASPGFPHVCALYALYLVPQIVFVAVMCDYAASFIMSVLRRYLRRKRRAARAAARADFDALYRLTLERDRALSEDLDLARAYAQHVASQDYRP